MLRRQEVKGMNIMHDFSKCHIPSRASSSRTGAPPISNNTLPGGTLRNVRKLRFYKDGVRRSYVPSSPELKRSFSLTHTSLVTLVEYCVKR